MALVRGFFCLISFYQEQAEQGGKAALRYGMTSTEGESMLGLWFDCVYIYTHTDIMSVQHPLHLAVGRFEILAQ